MQKKSTFKSRAKVALNNYFRRHSFPRLTLGVVLTMASLWGFLLSVILLHFGLVEMQFRYPLAVIGAYGFFLGSLRVWVEFERRRFKAAALGWKQSDFPNPIKLPDAWKRVSWLDQLDTLSDFSFDFDLDAEGCLFALVASFFTLLVAALISLVLVDAPALIADLFLDVFLAAALYRRLRKAAHGPWLGTALRKTWPTVLLCSVALFFLGFSLESMAPGQHTFSSALRQLHRGKTLDSAAELELP